MQPLRRTPEKTAGLNIGRIIIQLKITSKIAAKNLHFLRIQKSRFEMEHCDVINEIVFRTSRAEDFDQILDLFFNVYLKGLWSTIYDVTYFVEALIFHVLMAHSFVVRLVKFCHKILFDKFSWKKWSNF